MADVHGFVAAGFEGRPTEFERNFAERGEVGAAFAAVQDGEPVVDLWGGVADRAAGRPWGEDTLQLVFSGTKGFVAVCVLLAIERGLLDLDAPVARYWPEFGKEDVRVRDVVSHTARLPGIDEPVGSTSSPMPPHDAAARAAGAERRPARGLCYHALTYGWLCGELIRRVDGRTVGRFFAEEVAAPLGLELWIGLPEEHETACPRSRSRPIGRTLPRSDRRRTRATRSSARSGATRRSSIRERSPGTAAPITPPRSRRSARSARPARSRGCTPTSTACWPGDARARDGRQLAGRLGRAARTRRRFGVGFELQHDATSLGPPADAFGHGGAGGSTHGAWPSHRVGFSYAMNLMRDDEPVDPRAQALLAALYHSLDG